VDVDVVLVLVVSRLVTDDVSSLVMLLFRFRGLRDEAGGVG
jgi:hypothetical protein